ncbi:MAG: NUDIX domain-containing protein [Burkholderiaceae bacterium]
MRRSLDEQAAMAVVPRTAATVLILRDANDGPEVLMVRRSPNASFMPGAYVFPGGAVDDDDAQPGTDESDEQIERRIGNVLGVNGRARAFAVAALRECFEECGLWLGVDRPFDSIALRAKLHGGLTIGEIARLGDLPLATSGLHPWSRWVTPLGIPKRFDTAFFVCRAPDGQTPTVDEGETTTLAWVRPEAALASHSQGDFQMEFATVSTVRSLVPFARRSVHAIFEHAHGRRALPTIHPRLRLNAERHIVGVAMPGEAGYETLFGDG